ncbi:hypothetical protein [Gracilibacillus dipsosauri]|nr:hypothetical protein [Gracilibacillus dipsosauri]
MKTNNHFSNMGITLFKPTGVTHAFPLIDLQNKRVTGTVTYKGKVYMTVHIDLKKDTVEIKGSVDELQNISMDQESYLDMFKSQAEYFIENNISDPQ